MRDADVEAVHDAVGPRRSRSTPAGAASRSRRARRRRGAHVRLRHLLATDPGGCWVADDGARSPAPALALVREGVWGLSLLVVRPRPCSRRGSAARCWSARSPTATARAAASSSPRPTRARCAPTPAPASRCTRRPGDGRAARRRRDPACGRSRRTTTPMAAAVDRRVRGAAHGSDLDALRPPAARAARAPRPRLRRAPRAARVKLLAAADEEAAAGAAAHRARRARRAAHAPRCEWLTAAPAAGRSTSRSTRGLELRPRAARCSCAATSAPFAPVPARAAPYL